VNPKCTYYAYDVAQDSAAAHPRFLFVWWDLLGSSTERTLAMKVYGDYKSSAAGTDTRRALNGVFSYKRVLRAPSADLNNPYRFEGAATGLFPVVTGPTYHSKRTTDITTDFSVTPDPVTGIFRIAMPPNVTYVVFCPADSFHSDNSDPDDDFYLHAWRE
jgi:hypothetical protein